MTGPAEGARAVPGAVVAAWCVLWLVVGTWTGYELWQLGNLGGAVAETGRALGSAGEALQSLGRTPLVGGGTEELGGEIAASSEDIVTQAQVARSSLRRLAVLLGLTVSLLPSLGALLLLRLGGRPRTSGSDR